ncbi:hypothetical protein Tco_0321317 [Tanacetum coccineum]
MRHFADVVDVKDIGLGICKRNNISTINSSRDYFILAKGDFFQVGLKCVEVICRKNAGGSDHEGKFIHLPVVSVIDAEKELVVSVRKDSDNEHIAFVSNSVFKGSRRTKAQRAYGALRRGADQGTGFMNMSRIKLK